MSAPLNIVGTYQAIRTRLLEEFPDIDAETLSDTLDGLHGAQDIIASMIRHSLEDKAAAEALKQLESDYAARRQRLSARSEARRKAAFDLMVAIDERRIERPEFTLTIAAGKPSVIVTDDTVLPEQFFRITRTPNKTAVAEALERGAHVPGATWSNAAPHLTVRVK